MKDIDWDAFFEFCQKQAIVGVVYQGIEECSIRDFDINISQTTLLTWISQAEMIRGLNDLLYKRTSEISEYFSNAGYRSCILKGQGNALMYTNQYCRTPGDIDIWLEGNRKKITSFVKSKFKKVLEQYQHIDFPFFKDVVVEVHYTPSRLNSPLNNRKIQRYLKNMQQKQFGNSCVESDSKGCFRVPTDDFNLVFQIMHIMTHFFQ